MSTLSLSSPEICCFRPIQLVWGNATQACEQIERLSLRLAEQGAGIFWASLICSAEDWPRIQGAVQAAGAWRDWPLMALTQAVAGGGGLQILTRPLKDLHPLRQFDGRVIGMREPDGQGGQQVCLCGLSSEEQDPQRATRDCLERSAEALASAGLTWGKVYRTWYYNRDILGWYDSFNQERSRFFAGRDVEREHPPASTGIGLTPAEGGWLSFSALAGGFDPGSGTVASPLQGEATAYGSGFSRGYAQQCGDHWTLWVSGTASIDQAGNTVEIGDFEGQMRKTHEVVSALLSSRQLTWEHVTRLTAYVRRPEDLQRCRDGFEEMNTGGADPLIVPAVICRDDLLYEIELEASL